MQNEEKRIMQVLFGLIAGIILIAAIFGTPSPHRTVKLTCIDGKMYAVVLQGSHVREKLEVEDAVCTNKKGEKT